MTYNLILIFYVKLEILKSQNCHTLILLSHALDDDVFFFLMIMIF